MDTLVAQTPRPRVTATYRIATRPDRDPERTARSIAREQTLEVPPGAASPEIEATWLGRVEEVAPGADGAVTARVSYAPELFHGGLPQLLNVTFGNVSLMDGVRLVDVGLPSWFLAGLAGPSMGISGIRDIVGKVHGRPLVSMALKPVGLTAREMARLADTLVRAGVDIIKDDHGLTDQSTATLVDRVTRIGDAVRSANAAAGTSAVYFPNVTAPVDRLVERTTLAHDAGCPGVVLCASLVGLDVMRWLAETLPGVALMAHPAHANCAPARDSGIAPEVLLGTLYRLAGADAVVYVNAGGRFAWPAGTCRRINDRLRRPLGCLKPSFPVPAGGIQAERVPEWFREYGPETLLLIGGSILKSEDVEATARSVVEAAHAAGAAMHARSTLDATRQKVIP